MLTPAGAGAKLGKDDFSEFSGRRHKIERAGGDEDVENSHLSELFWGSHVA